MLCDLGWVMHLWSSNFPCQMGRGGSIFPHPTLWRFNDTICLSSKKKHKAQHEFCKGLLGFPQCWLKGFPTSSHSMCNRMYLLLKWWRKAELMLQDKWCIVCYSNTKMAFLTNYKFHSLGLTISRSFHGKTGELKPVWPWHKLTSWAPQSLSLYSRDFPGGPCAVSLSNSTQYLSARFFPWIYHEDLICLSTSIHDSHLKCQGLLKYLLGNLLIALYNFSYIELGKLKYRVFFALLYNNLKKSFVDWKIWGIPTWCC
jgi:hypothetical protein